MQGFFAVKIEGIFSLIIVLEPRTLHSEFLIIIPEHDLFSCCLRNASKFILTTEFSGGLHVTASTLQKAIYSVQSK
ncbi:hypothetical protein F383_11499 [Gossypium arboreum]|uniref:Uncharacterized protein n=2 Tax=Gossypium TaxID=3633 RepID=A0A0B0NKG8_GOSAR|nr:hypothetical protein ERO13_A10G164800v2 [Gossypium hirsutum]KHG11596.1 hypothetical protein F383_11499 [Gossypium arboreum]TYI07004.1 hypothetical protein ES332_A10G197000v1 [Gossypium tomentosum]KAG4180421.1 hypothetical protein ERO13_A10G164800v2 [Gossypium hirsutum]KAG4180422.1 hypothetical protein ERO13_A10G164800v2 [Gossypium hirsutum]